MGQVSRLAPKTLPLRPHCPAHCGAAALPLCHWHGASRASACACSPHRCFDEAHRHEASSMIAPLCAGMLACIEPQVPRTPTSCTGRRRSLADWPFGRHVLFCSRTDAPLLRTISSSSQVKSFPVIQHRDVSRTARIVPNRRDRDVQRSGAHPCPTAVQQDACPVSRVTRVWEPM